MGKAALALDGSNAYRERGAAQHAADNAALAAAWESCNGGNNAAAIAAGLSVASASGYASGVTITPVSGEFEAAIVTSLDGNFSQVIGVSQIQTGATATAECTVGLSGGYAVFAGSTTCNSTVDWSGSTTVIGGNIHSNGDIHVGGGSNIVNGSGTHVDANPPNPGLTWNPAASNPTQVGAALPYPVTYNITDYMPGGSAATAAGSRYYNFGNAKIDMGLLDDAGDPHGKLWDSATNTLADGLYYTTNDIDLSASNITGNVTLVTNPPIGTNGVVSLSGSNHYLRPFSSGLLIFSRHQKQSPLTNNSNCASAAVKMSGSTHDWAGVIYAPTGTIEMSGSSNSTFDGSLVGYKVRFNGSSQGISYNSSYAAADPSIGLQS